MTRGASGGERVRRAGSSKPFAALAALVALAALALIAACGDHGGAPLGPRGAGERYEILVPGPAPLIGPAGGRMPERLAVRVRPLPGTEASAAGIQVRFRILSGSGRLLDSVALTDGAGDAAVPYAPPASADSTAVHAYVADDPGAALRLSVLARPLVALAGDSGSVHAVPGASAGVVLQVPAGQTWDLVPYVTSADGARHEYVLRRDSGVHVDVDMDADPVGASAVELAPAKAAVLAPAAGASAVEPAGAGALPASLDVFNCLVHLHRPASLAHAGARIALYVDASETPDPGRAAELARLFDTTVAPVIERLFGAPTDLDGNGRVLAVMSPAMPAEDGVYCGSVHLLGREVVYVRWDAAGRDAKHLQVLAHEYQHVVNASQHYRSGRGGERSDVPWLNEGFSLVAEWKAGYPAGDLSRTLAFLGRVNRSLPLLAERYGPGSTGGWFLFALYLGDRFGEGLYRSLGESGLIGRANVERATGLPFRDLLRDWFVTLALSDGPARPEPAWSYASIRLAGEEERAATCSCLPGVRLPGVAFEGLPAAREFTLLRTLDVQDADFYRWSVGEAPGALYFQAGGEPDVELFAVRRR